MNTYKTHTLFLLWFLLTSLTGFGLYMTWDKGLLQWIVLTDNTRICVVIILAFLLGSGLAGWRSIYLSLQSLYFDQFKRGLRTFNQGQSICNDYLTHCGNTPHESQLMAEVMAEKARGTHQVGWFVTGLMLKLGLLGTVVGFTIMLGSLEGLEQLDISDIKTLMQQMTQGMAVAMNTTLVGLVGSILLSIQLLLLDRHADRLVADTVDFAHRTVKAA